MKKSILFAGCGVALVGALAITYYGVNTPPSPELALSNQAIEIFNEGGCISCHSESPTLPFYSSFPVIGELVKKDAKDGVKHFNISNELNNLANGIEVNKVALAKIEKSTIDGTMPLPKYYLVHWGSQTTPKKKEIILNWVKEQRLANYSNGLSAAEFANEPIQPIAPPKDLNMEKVALGEMLFHDTRLSANNTVSCATCHDLATGGVDNLRFSEGINGQFGGVNAPTVFNSHFNFVQFWDGRAADLQAQAAGPPMNSIEMGNKSWDEVIVKLNDDNKFTEQFNKVYPGSYTGESITDAIAEFERTLITPDSRFDLYLKGDKTALSESEIHGYELFKQQDCATCHTGSNMGGYSYDLMGLYGDYFSNRGDEITTEDHGRFKETKAEYDLHRFKVPTLRNIALTWPYLHDGTAESLEEAVDVMSIYQNNKTLTEVELASIVGYLNTLTGKYNGKELTNTNIQKL